MRDQSLRYSVIGLAGVKARGNEHRYTLLLHHPA